PDVVVLGGAVPGRGEGGGAGGEQQPGGDDPPGVRRGESSEDLEHARGPPLEPDGGRRLRQWRRSIIGGARRRAVAKRRGRAGAGSARKAGKPGGAGMRPMCQRGRAGDRGSGNLSRQSAREGRPGKAWRIVKACAARTYYPPSVALADDLGG